MLGRATIAALALILMSCIVPKAFAIPLTSVPNLHDISLCFSMGGGNLECSGLTETQLLANPGGLQSIPFPDHVVTGGISDRMGNISPVGEYFVLTIGPIPGVNSLSSMFLSFFGGGREYPFEVTYADVVLSHGLTLTDPNQLLGPADLNYGTIVFGFRSAIPEPGSLGLMGIGLAVLASRRRAYRTASTVL